MNGLQGVMESNRFFGDVADRVAAQQIGVDSSYTIFMCSSVVTYDGKLDEFNSPCEDENASYDYGRTLMSIEDLLAEVKQKLISVPLPIHYRMVGMKPINSNDESTFKYGVVNLKEAGYQ